MYVLYSFFLPFVLVLLAATKLNISPRRLSFASVDPVTGRVVIHIQAADGRSINHLGGTMYQSSFRVVGMQSISVNNATYLLESCGINAARVEVVNGTVVQFQANNINSTYTDCLANVTDIDPKSIQPAGVCLGLIGVEDC